MVLQLCHPTLRVIYCKRHFNKLGSVTAKKVPFMRWKLILMEVELLLFEELFYAKVSHHGVIQLP